MQVIFLCQGCQLWSVAISEVNLVSLQLIVLISCLKPHAACFQMNENDFKVFFNDTDIYSKISYMF